ncbi:MAG TPA: transposase [Bacteroidota bacterium]|nr:transposase [Bacteroidota bacterium]
MYNRGCSRNRIFRSSENFRFLQRTLRDYTSHFEVLVIAYALMPNHYHFVLKQCGDKSVGDCMQRIFNKYVKAFNKMYHRSGTLFEGPFRAIQIDEVGYLLRLCRYIHRNPLEAGLVKRIEQWEFSDYCDWIHPKAGVESPAVSLFPKYFKLPFEYAQFVLAGETPPEMQNKLIGLD